MTTKKQQKIKSLTWKYFLQQKFQEVFKGLFYVILGIFIPFLVGSFLDVEGTEGNFMVIFLINWIIGAIILCGCVFSCWIIYHLLIPIIIEWIKDNWNEAKERVRIEVKK